jgi:hypothetical protein
MPVPIYLPNFITGNFLKVIIRRAAHKGTAKVIVKIKCLDTLKVAGRSPKKLISKIKKKTTTSIFIMP